MFFHFCHFQIEKKIVLAIFSSELIGIEWMKSVFDSTGSSWRGGAWWHSTIVFRLNSVPYLDHFLKTPAVFSLAYVPDNNNTRDPMCVPESNYAEITPAQFKFFESSLVNGIWQWFIPADSVFCGLKSLLNVREVSWTKTETCMSFLCDREIKGSCPHYF